MPDSAPAAAFPIIQTRAGQLAHTLSAGDQERALGIAHRGFVLESGRTVLEGRSADLLRSPEIRKVFLGG